METMRVIAPVRDPLRPEVEDAVIKEARKHARRRRIRLWGWGGAVVLAGMLGVAAAYGPLNDASPLQLTTPTFTDLPPADAVLSSPTVGVLAVEYPSEHVRAWVFADGRLITMRMFGTFNAHGWSNSGFLEQRLTPSGVEMIRAYVLAHAGRLVEETEPENERVRDLRIQVGDKLYERAITTGEYWRCQWAGCEGYISNLNETLTASAWVDKEYRQYVPSQYRICAHAGHGDKEAPAELVRAALPAEVSKLFASGAPSGWGCIHVSPDAARTAEASLVAAGFPVVQRTAQEYTFTIPAHEGPEYMGTVWVGAVLPNGDAEEPGG